MNVDELRSRHKAAMPSWMPLYYEKPLELARGEGFRVWDSDGNEYLDFFGGIVTCISGHDVPEITEAIKGQVDKILHTSTLYLIENQVRLAEKLIELAPISGEKKAFFVGSGSEANEAALLFATCYRQSSEIIALRSSYHGSTFMTMGITGQSTWSPTSRSGLDVAYARNPYALRCALCRNEGEVQPPVRRRRAGRSSTRRPRATSPRLSPSPSRASGASSRRRPATSSG